MGLVKLAAKNSKEYAKYTPAGSIVFPTLAGGTIGGLAGTLTGNRALGGIGLLAGLGGGIYNHHKLNEEGEFDKRYTKHYKGTITGLGSFGSSVLPMGLPIYAGVKALRHHKMKNDDNE